MRAEIVDLFQQITLSIREQGDPLYIKMLSQYLSFIVEFLQATLQLNGTSGLELLQSACGLLLDLSQLYKNNQKLKNELSMQFVSDLLKRLHDEGTAEDKNMAATVFQSIN